MPLSYQDEIDQVVREVHIRADERERCAKIAETIQLVQKGHPQIDALTPYDAMMQIAAAIRKV